MSLIQPAVHSNVRIAHAQPEFEPGPAEAQRLFDLFIPVGFAERDDYLEVSQKFIDEKINNNAKSEQTLLTIYEIALIRYYTLEGFYINDVLSKNKIPIIQNESIKLEDYESLSREIDRILPLLPAEYQEIEIEKQNGKSLTLFSGAEPTTKKINDIEVGNISYPTFFSTTPKLNIATKFSGVWHDFGIRGNEYIYVITDSKSTKISDISKMPEEDEYINPTNTQFYVDKIEWRYLDLKKLGFPGKKEIFDMDVDQIDCATYDPYEEKTPATRPVYMGIVYMHKLD
jgi:hypothetical protein